METRNTGKQSLEEQIASLRRQKGMSQERVAEQLGVSRQAVAKWESGKSRPSTDNLIRLADLLGVSVEDMLEREPNAERAAGTDITVSRMTWLCTGLSILVTAAYLILGLVAKAGTFHVGTFLCLFILVFPDQLFLHVYTSQAVRGNSFDGLAGFDRRIAYNEKEVRRMLVQIDLHIGITTTVYVFLIAAVGLTAAGPEWLVGVFVYLYGVEFVAVFLFYNYRWTDRLYREDADRRRARCGFPSMVLYLLVLFAGVAALVVSFTVRGLENNTVPAMKLALLLICGVGAATAGFAVEDHRIRSWDPETGRYHAGKVWLFCLGVSILLFAGMFFF